MKAGIGKLLKSEGSESTYEMPDGAKTVTINRESRDISFECDVIRRTDDVEEEYQYKQGDIWVRVTPKKSAGKFKNVPVRK